MKCFCFSFLALSWCLTLGAQTNPPAATAESPAASAIVATNDLTAMNAPASTNAPAAEPTRIDIVGDKLVGNFKASVGTYIGHAGIDSPEMHLRCEVLHFELPRLTSSNYNRITALSNVVIDLWTTNHLTGDRAIYTKTLSNGLANVLLELIGNGNACVTNPAFRIIDASNIVYNPITGDMHHDGKMVIFVGTNGDLSSPFGRPTPTRTNAPAHKTNAPAFKPQTH